MAVPSSPERGLDLEVASEEQPLLRSSSSHVDRAQFEAERADATRSAVLTHEVLVMVLGIGILFAVSFLLYVEIKSWYILIVYYRRECDAGLGNWLLAYLLMELLAPALRGALNRIFMRSEEGQQRTPLYVNGITYLMQLVWVILGYHWCIKATTCPSTNPELYNWVRFVSVLGIFLTILQFSFVLLVLCAMRAFVWMVHAGWIRNPKAAAEGTVDLLDRVEYRAETFAAAGQPDDGRPSKECCCCMEDFSSEKPIVMTPCGHYFHLACLGDWLKLAKTCPLCREDLEVAATAPGGGEGRGSSAPV